MMSLLKLLNHKDLMGLEVINEKADLTRMVYTIESTETPDVFNYIGINSFVVTTAMIYNENQKELLSLIRKLNSKPIAGLGIKLGRFIEKLDDEIIEVANELQFPLILIPRELTLGEVYRKLLSILWNNQNTELLEAKNLKRRLYDMVMNGADIERILIATSESTNRDFVVVDIFGELIAKGSSNIEQIEKATSFVEQNKTKMRCINTYSQEKGLTFYPIRSISGNTHYLFAFDRKKNMAASSFIMEEIILLLQLILYRILFNVFNDIQLRDDLLNRLVNPKREKESSSLNQMFFEGEKFSLKASINYKLIVGRFMNFNSYKFNESKFMRREENYISAYQMVKRNIKRRYGDTAILLADLDSWQYVILIQDQYNNIESLIEDIAKNIEDILDERIIFFIGETIFGGNGIGSSFYKIKKKMDCYEDKKRDVRVVDYKPISIKELLKSQTQGQMAVVCQEVLKDLAYPDDPNKAELRKTLKTYLENRCSVVETALKMYVHRNTIRYRIKKCEEILGKELNDTDFCFEIQLLLILSE